MEKEMLAIVVNLNLVKENLKSSWDLCNQMKEWQ